jgi:hypothetical protein
MADRANVVVSSSVMAEGVAEGVGFEPTGTRIPKLFKSFAFGRSAIPPEASILPSPHFHRKCTNTRPKLRESFSTRWYRGLMSG